MNDKAIALEGAERAGSSFQRFFRRRVLDRLARLERGRLVLVEGATRHQLGPARHEREAEVRIHDPRFWTSVALRGAVGAGESYMDGWWSTDDLGGLLAMIVADEGVARGLNRGLARLGAPFLRALHLLRRNTIAGSRRNISAHYDLGNDFYSLWLDPTLLYSSGVFPRPEATMEEASIAKMELLAGKLDLSPGLEVLEIGSGWGAFAIHLARDWGCRVTTTTISREQHAMVIDRVRRAGLEDRIEVLLQDYRQLEGRFDRIASIEMFEAVGAEYHRTFFRRCGELLADDGLMVMQTITINERHYARARRETDFIKAHVFPGCCIPSLGAISSALARCSDLDLVEAEDIGDHYARTLRHWRESFHQAIPAVRRLGFDDRFLRMWEFYLCYCEAGFRERQTRNHQLVLAKPGNRSPIRSQRSNEVGR